MKNKVFFLSTILSLFCTGCTKEYSTAYQVRCYLNVTQYPELFNVMASMGEYATIRPLTSQGKIKISSNTGTTDYSTTADMKYYSYGLGGLIAGVNYNKEYVAYDLSCPNCNRADTRLTIGDAGIAKCSKCGLSYDLNNYGVIYSSSSTTSVQDPRGLYRYRISYDGTTLSIYN